MAKRLYLIPRDAEVPEGVPADEVVRVPLVRFGATSTTHVPHIDELGCVESLAAFSTPLFVQNPRVKERIASGAIQTIGSAESIDLERIAAQHLDGLFVSGFSPKEIERLASLQKLGLAVLPTAEFAEETPLGRAEWIRFFGAFLGREKEADALFAKVEKRYEELKSLAAGVKSRPTVFLNTPYRGAWNIAGGRSYMARYLEDAGAKYLWDDAPTAESITVSLEAVIRKASTADFWLHPGMYKSRAEMAKDDPRFEAFRAWREGRVVSNDARTTPAGGSDFWETGVAHPERVLADLIAVFHPDLLPNHRFEWYRTLP